MEIQDIIISFFEVAILLIYGIIAIRAHKPYKKEVAMLSFATACLIFLKATLHFAVSFPNTEVLLAAYGIIRAVDLLALLVFCAAYSHMKRSKIRSVLILGILLTDVVFFIYTIFRPEVYNISFTNNDVTVGISSAYGINTIALLAIMIVMIQGIVTKITRENHIFWPRMLLVLGFIIFDCWAIIKEFSRRELSLENRPIFFVMVSILFFFTIVVKSRFLRSWEYSYISDSVVQPVFLFGRDDECMLANKPAKEMFNLDVFDLRNVPGIVRALTEGEEVGQESGFEKLCEYKSEDGIRYLRMKYQTITRKEIVEGKVYSFTDVTRETLDLREQTRLARYDQFTMIYNREWLFSKIQQTLEDNPGEEYFIVCSDIRDFKVFNDVFGKEAGDQIILRTAEVLRKLHDEDVVIYYGRVYADRFGMLCKKKGFSKDRIVNEFLNIGHPFKEDYFHLNIHFGIYDTSMEENIPVENMFDRANVAIDAIKNDVNIRTYHYNEEMRDEKIWEQTISTNIDKALKDGQIRIVVQPQVDNKERIIGGEALIRWRHPDSGEISPGNFIPILEKTGLVTSADLFVWEESCKLLRRWKDLGYNDYYISVNISATDFIFTDIFTIFQGLVEKYDINAPNLKLEITETAMMTDVLERIVLIKRLREYGFTVELDDFGSGYSSLNMLKEIPVDVIKLDMKFLYSYNNEPEDNSKKIIGHMISMAKDLDMEIVAEGVETEGQLNFLRDIGCDVYQGYYFSKPVEISVFESNQGIA